MAEETPVFQIQRVYLKDLSLEQPNSPAILLEQEQPSVDIQLGVEATPVVEGIFEVAVTERGLLGMVRAAGFGAPSDGSPAM